jgi:hypothetical protein
MYCNLILKTKTIKQANNCRFITTIKTKSFNINIPYNDVKNVVVVRTTYVDVLALGFPCRKSFIVGKNPRNVTIPPILYKNVSAATK